MDALIRRHRSGTDLAMVDIAGRPLLARQIQWLHAVGCDRVVVEVDDGDDEAASWLAEHAERFGPALSVLRVDGPLDVDEAIAQSGLPDRGPVVVLPSCVLGDGDLARVLPRCGSGGAVVHLEPPPGSAPGTRSGALRIRLPGTVTPHLTGPGWGIDLESRAQAERLGWAALAGELPAQDFMDHGWPIQIHAAEVRPGIWLARGAQVAASATLVGPLLVGAGAVIDDGAEIGPNVVVGARAAVARGVRVRDRRIADATLVARGGQYSFARDGSLWRALVRHGKEALGARNGAELAWA
jgi:hypothetical protein